MQPDRLVAKVTFVCFIFIFIHTFRLYFIFIFIFTLPLSDFFWYMFLGVAVLVAGVVLGNKPMGLNHVGGYRVDANWMGSLHAADHMRITFVIKK